MEDYALLHAYDPGWRPHTSWAEARQQPRKLRGKKLAEFLRGQEELKRQALYLSYVRTIIRFFADQLYVENWHMFWGLRWKTNWYETESINARAANRNLRSIDDAAKVISETRPADLSSQWSNRLIDLICWYARWTAQLQIEPELWKEAERDACDLLKQPDQWPTIYAGTADY